MLWNARRVDLRIAHLVRDSRGVAFSNMKSVPRQSTIDGRTERGRHPPIGTAARWIWMNLAYDVLSAKGAPLTIVRYEDLVRAPRRELTRLAAFAGSPTSADDLAFIGDGEAELPAAHIVSGNRLRSTTGPVQIAVDESWRTGLDPWERWLVSMMTLPLTLRYRQRALHAQDSASCGPSV
jgi:hypothetical protein